MPGFELAEKTKERITLEDMVSRLAEMLKVANDEQGKLDEEVGILGHTLYQTESRLTAQVKMNEAKTKQIKELKEENEGLEAILQNVQDMCIKAGIDKDLFETHEEMVESLIKSRENYEQGWLKAQNTAAIRGVELKEITELLDKAGYGKIPRLKYKVIALIGDRDLYAKITKEDQAIIKDLRAEKKTIMKILKGCLVDSDYADLKKRLKAWREKRKKK
jgi:hypothetical protein